MGKNSSASLPVALRVQRWAGRLSFLPIAFCLIVLFRYSARYAIRNKRAIEEQFQNIRKRGKPLLICGNHLTLIDSLLLLWAFAPPWKYLACYRSFAWNFPATENAKKKWTWRCITFLNKCILVDRAAPVQVQEKFLSTVSLLLEQGEYCMIFPEGTRSRSGRLSRENLTYGVGKILQKIPDCEVLCAYLRGDGQEQYSDFPKKGERFSLSLRLIRPSTQEKGLRAARDLAEKIHTTLCDMEEEYFYEHRKRHC
jgi:1-acyl-sn-glycerol-3-phosphate acyltransferase